MSTLNVTSPNTPLVIPATNLLDDTIVVSTIGTVTDLTIDINITAPDEGGGPDPSLLAFSINRVDLSKSVVLHANEALAINGINYDDGRDPFDGPGALEAMFDGVSLNGNWLLGIDNSFSSADGTLNSWGINFTYDAPVVAPITVTQPAALTIPAGIKYGVGRGQKKNVKLFYNVQGAVSASNVLDTPLACPLNGIITDITIKANNSGSSGTSAFSLYRVRNGAVSTLINSTLKLNSGNNYIYTKYNDRSFDLGVQVGDLIFLSLNSAATGLADLSINIVVAEK